MTITAKLFINGDRQAVDLPDEFRFQQSEVYIWRDPLTGDVVLSASEPQWQVRDIHEGLEEADKGEFANERQVEAVFAKYGG